MSTNDVPGANPANKDVLHAGCWAEHADGSLLKVDSTERNMVIFELFDRTTPNEPLAFRHAMPEDEFKRMFSWPPTGVSQDRWTWHDKTGFPWDLVMKSHPRPRPGPVSAEQQWSAARRVADALNLRGEKVREEDLLLHHAEQTVPRGFGVWDRIDRAVREFMKS